MHVCMHVLGPSSWQFCSCHQLCHPPGTSFSSLRSRQGWQQRAAPSAVQRPSSPSLSSPCPRHPMGPALPLPWRFEVGPYRRQPPPPECAKTDPVSQPSAEPLAAKPVAGSVLPLSCPPFPGVFKAPFLPVRQWQTCPRWPGSQFKLLFKSSQ